MLQSFAKDTQIEITFVKHSERLTVLKGCKSLSALISRAKEEVKIVEESLPEIGMLQS